MAAGHFMMAFEPAVLLRAGDDRARQRPVPADPAEPDQRPLQRRRSARGWAYNVYYVGVNVGGFLAPLICGTLGETLRLALGLRRRRRRHARRALASTSGASAICRQSEPRASRSLPASSPDASRPRHRPAAARHRPGRDVFRGAYEQIGNTFALWMRDGVDRVIGGVEIGAMTWFFSLNPLLVMVMTPLLLARWKRQAERGRELSPTQKMACGALIVAASYLLLAGAEAFSGGGRAHWLWLLAFFVDLHARRALHPAQRARPVRAARPAEARRDHGRRLVPRDLHRQPRGRPGRAPVEPPRPHPLLRAARGDRDGRGGPALPARPPDQADPRRARRNGRHRPDRRARRNCEAPECLRPGSTGAPSCSADLPQEPSPFR